MTRRRHFEEQISHDMCDWLIELRYDYDGNLVESRRINEIHGSDDGCSSCKVTTRSKETAMCAKVKVASSRWLHKCCYQNVLGTVTLFAAALTCAFSPPALGAGLVDELAKHGIDIGGGIDPHGNSWLSIQHSLEQFRHPEFMLRLFLSLSLAVVCAWVVAWHPRSSRFKSLTNLEERKTLVLLGMVGAVVAELSGISQTLAFVIFGIGALLRFRTVLDNPKLTGKAITVVVIGLACGMGSWVMAIFVTVFSWALIFWLDSRVACRLRIRLSREADLELTFHTVQSILTGLGCRLQNAMLYKGKRQLVYFLHIPAELDLRKVETDIRTKLPDPEDARIDFSVV